MMWQPTLVRLILYIEDFGSFMCRYMQKILIIVVFLLHLLFSYLYVQDLFTSFDQSGRPKSVRQLPEVKQLIWRRSNKQVKIVFLAVGVFMLYNLVYNYVMAYRVGPGYPTHVLDSVLDQHSVDKKCKKCQGRKPIRTHHCSICNKCVMQMDHHCPWLGNCIGHFNRRYFIRFLTYLSLTCFLVVLQIIYLDLPSTYIFIEGGDKFIFVLTVGIVIGLFALFHWAIALWGRATLQVCEINDGYLPSKSICQNFQIIFGTRNIILAMLPYYIPLTYHGCQWNKSPYNRVSGIEYDEGSITTQTTLTIQAAQT